MPLDWLEVIEKTISMIYASFDHREWIQRKKDQERHRRSGLNVDTYAWKMDKKWGGKMDKIVSEGSAIDKANNTWKKYYYRRKLNEHRQAIKLVKREKVKD